MVFHDFPPLSAEQVLSFGWHDILRLFVWVVPLQVRGQSNLEFVKHGQVLAFVPGTPHRKNFSGVYVGYSHLVQPNGRPKTCVVVWPDACLRITWTLGWQACLHPKWRYCRGLINFHHFVAMFTI